MSSVVGVGDFIGWEGGCLLIGKAVRPVPRHSHQAIQIIFGYAGPVLLQGAADAAWSPFPLGVIPSRQPHAMDATGCTYNAVIFVEPETRAGRALTERYPGDGMAAVDDPNVRASSEALFATWLGQRGRPAVMEAALGVVQTLTAGVEPTVVTDERILEAIAYINANLRGRVTLDAVAKGVHLSPGRLRHLFVEEAGMGLRPYVLWRRFVRAWDLLTSGESVTAAAHGAGFADSAHFARTSRQMFGFPPSLLVVGQAEHSPLSSGRHH